MRLYLRKICCYESAVVHQKCVNLCLSVPQVILYSEPDFQGECQVFDKDQEAVSEKLLTKSCRVSGGR